MKKYLTTGLQVLLVLLFIGPAMMKLTANPMIVTSFENFGYTPWFMYFIGTAELLGALGIAFGSFVHKKLPLLAVLGLMIIMIGAVGSHITFGDPITAAIPATVFFILLATHLRVLSLKNNK
jgi:putative oxidoreductase